MTSGPVSGNRKPKSKGAPVQRTAKQEAALEKIKVERDLANQQTQAKANAAQLAQIINLVIAGKSYEEIGASIGATADEVERMVINGSQRYVRTQPALRTYVRNHLSGVLTQMMDADIKQAVDPSHPEKLEHQDRLMRLTAQMADLWGAKMPTQSEVKIDAAPELVQQMVDKLARAQGRAYDMDVFDAEVVEDTGESLVETVHDSVDASLLALEQASRNVEMPQEDDEEF